MAGKEGEPEDPDYSASTRFAIDILFLSPLIILRRFNRTDLLLFVTGSFLRKGGKRGREMAGREKSMA